jgi:hypothetical protein
MRQFKTKLKANRNLCTGIPHVVSFYSTATLCSGIKYWDFLHTNYVTMGMS